MSDPNGLAITARHLRKEYIIHTRQATTLKEMVVRNIFDSGEKIPYVALRDLSFELPKGRSLAVVGANGSGKSTLLKLISGISDPTSGELAINGRIAALLEVGAGFQPEFTGMENIFLQCSILGLKREEILSKLDAIIAFSELENFIHTPVKRYSSGMYVRLGFAIAVHVEAEILLLDEVLAVGDQAFQTKCIRKIQELHQQGCTIVFVSHVLHQIESVADLVLWLHQGEAVDFGDADIILPKFYESLQNQNSTNSSEVHMDERALAALPTGRFAARNARITKVEFFDDSMNVARSFDQGEVIRIRVQFEVLEELLDVEVHVGVGTMGSQRAAYWGSGGQFASLERGCYTCDMEMEGHFLPQGRYLFSIMLGRPGDINHTYDIHLRMYAVSIHKPGRPPSPDPDAGLLMPWGYFANPTT
ncbi:ABC transporter ATP-binding protein [Candidatus Sumerlaeota bacterium]|nr:ABC transporter ATP-binding protein [Candidatus Sumerlaeota bacterium]